MSGGILGRYLIRKIAEHQTKKQISASFRQLMEITQAYLVYIDDKPEDQNSEVQQELEIMIEHIFTKF